MRSRARRRSVSICVSPGPRVPMPPSMRPAPRRSRWVHRPRMRGLWTHLERLGAGRIDGGIGTRGPGETQIETDRRLARDRISALRRKLAGVRSSRGVMRAERERVALPRVALAGYTNAGKSTLLDALTAELGGAGSGRVGVRDRLFHTLDPTTRTVRIGGGARAAPDNPLSLRSQATP